MGQVSVVPAPHSASGVNMGRGVWQSRGVSANWAPGQGGGTIDIKIELGMVILSFHNQHSHSYVRFWDKLGSFKVTSGRM